MMLVQDGEDLAGDIVGPRRCPGAGLLVPEVQEDGCHLHKGGKNADLLGLI